jgi:hypothetical protein
MKPMLKPKSQNKNIANFLDIFIASWALDNQCDTLYRKAIETNHVNLNDKEGIKSDSQFL